MTELVLAGDRYAALRRYLWRLPESAVVAVWIAANLFVYGTEATYAVNRDMFTLPFDLLLSRFYLKPAAYLVLALVGIALVLPTRALYRVYIVLLFGVGVMSWVQGNFFVWNYGVFDGTAINFATHHWKGALEIVAWLVVLAILFRFRDRVHRHVAFVAGGLCLLQGLAVPFRESRAASTSSQIVTPGKASTPARPGAPEVKAVVRSHPEWVFEFSTSGNVIVYISDGLQSDVFSEIIKGADRFADDLDGFIFFDDTSTNSRITVGAYTALLTGVPYDGSVPFQTYANRTIQRDNIGLALHRKGFTIAHVLESKNLFYQPEHCVSPFVFTERFSSDDLASRTLLDATLFRHAPHFAKPYVFDGTLGVAATLLGAPTRPGTANQITAYMDFLDILDWRMTSRDGPPTFKLFHLLNAHPPLSLNEHCQYEAMSTIRENYVRTNVCSMKLFMRFLKRLKGLGVYDNSLIIFLGDHGAKGQRTGITTITAGLNVADAWPALAVKPPNSHGPLRVSHAPAQISDVAATIAEHAGIEDKPPGRSLLSLREDEARERPFFFGKPGERWEKTVAQPPTHAAYVIRGPVKDAASWSPVQLPESPPNP